MIAPSSWFRLESEIDSLKPVRDEFERTYGLNVPPVRKIDDVLQSQRSLKGIFVEAKRGQSKDPSRISFSQFAQPSMLRQIVQLADRDVVFLVVGDDIDEDFKRAVSKWKSNFVCIKRSMLRDELQRIVSKRTNIRHRPIRPLQNGGGAGTTIADVKTVNDFVEFLRESSRSATGAGMPWLLLKPRLVRTKAESRQVANLSPLFNIGELRPTIPVGFISKDSLSVTAKSVGATALFSIVADESGTVVSVRGFEGKRSKTKAAWERHVGVLSQWSFAELQRSKKTANEEENDPTWLIRRPSRVFSDINSTEFSSVVIARCPARHLLDGQRWYLVLARTDEGWSTEVEWFLKIFSWLLVAECQKELEAAGFGTHLRPARNSMTGSLDQVHRVVRVFDLLGLPVNASVASRLLRMAIAELGVRISTATSVEEVNRYLDSAESVPTACIRTMESLNVVGDAEEKQSVLRLARAANGVLKACANSSPRVPIPACDFVDAIFGNKEAECDSSADDIRRQMKVLFGASYREQEAIATIEEVSPNSVRCAVEVENTGEYFRVPVPPRAFCGDVSGGDVFRLVLWDLWERWFGIASAKQIKQADTTVTRTESYIQKLRTLSFAEHPKSK